MGLVRAITLTLAVIMGGCAANASGWQVMAMGDDTLRVYSSGPETADVGIVLVHDWFGVTEMTEGAVEHLAGLGYRAVAVDLYGGASAETHPDAWALMQALDADAAARSIDAALTYAAEGNRNVALLGFSMGVSHAVEAARRNSDRVGAIAVWYGDIDGAYGEAGALGVPILAILGELDGNAGEQANALEVGIAADGGLVETLVYPGVGHAYAQPLFNGGENFSEAATAASWELTETFLTRNFEAD